jgi:xylitol oxidase
MDPAEIRGRYEKFTDFAALAAEYDPKGCFRNDWVSAVLG